MSAFEVLALIGALTGPPAALAQTISVWRDRPLLRVGFGVNTQLGGPPSVWVEIRNDGRQPITVKEAGFYGSEMPVEIHSQDFGKGKTTASYKYPVIREPVLLTPGVYKRAIAPI